MMQTIRNKALAVLIIGLLLPLTLYGAGREEETVELKEIVSLRITDRLGESIKLRYQVNGERRFAWTKLDLADPVIRFSTADKLQDTVYLQRSTNGIFWSQSTRIAFDKESGGWRMLTKTGEFSGSAAASVASDDSGDGGQETVRLRISTKSGEVEAYRFQVNGEKAGNWTQLEGGEPVAEFQTADKSAERVYLQYTLNGRRWSESVMLVYDEMRERWLPVSTTTATTGVRSSGSGTSDSSGKLRASLGGVYAIPLSEMPDTYYEQCAGAVLELSQDAGWSRNVLGSLKLIYSMGKSESDLVGTVHEITLGAGMGYRAELGILAVQPDVGGGVIVHLVQNGEGRLLGVFTDGYLDTGLKVSVGIAETRELYVRGGVQLYLEDGDYGLLGIVQAGLTAEL